MYKKFILGLTLASISTLVAAKGKSFPHCSFVSNDQDGSTTGHDGQSKISSYTHNNRVYLYVDDKLVTTIKKS